MEARASVCAARAGLCVLVVGSKRVLLQRFPSHSLFDIIPCIIPPMSGPPPLEDMSESLSSIRAQREQRQMEHDRHTAYIKMMKQAHEKTPSPKGILIFRPFLTLHRY